MRGRYCVLALLLGYELVAYTLALVAERREHGDPTPWVSQAPDSIMTWGVPFLLIAVSAIALWRSEWRRVHPSGSGAGLAPV